MVEYIDGTTLYDHVRNKRGSHFNAKKLVLELFEVLVELHDAHIAHRDFKSKNIMVTRDGGDIKLIDFGASARYANSHDRALFQTNKDGDSHHYRKEAFSMAIDWARFGIVMYEIITGKLPLGDRKVPIADGCLNGKLFKMLKCHGKLHGDACDLFKQFIRADWQNRWGMTRESQEKVRKHPWFKGIKSSLAITSKQEAKEKKKENELGKENEIQDQDDSNLIIDRIVLSTKYENENEINKQKNASLKEKRVQKREMENEKEKSSEHD